MFRVQAVPVAGFVSRPPISLSHYSHLRRAAGFENRGGVHADWRGLRDAELVASSGIEGATFVHATGFIAGNVTMDGAIKMAVASL
mgnify:CR=1 FL=1